MFPSMKLTQEPDVNTTPGERLRLPGVKKCWTGIEPHCYKIREVYNFVKLGKFHEQQDV